MPGDKKRQDKKPHQKKTLKITPIDELKDKSRAVRFMDKTELASMAPNTIRTQHESTVTQGSNNGNNIYQSQVSESSRGNVNYNQIMSAENVHYSGVMSNGIDNDATHMYGPNDLVSPKGET